MFVLQRRQLAEHFVKTIYKTRRVKENNSVGNLRANFTSSLQMFQNSICHNVPHVCRMDQG